EDLRQPQGLNCAGSVFDDEAPVFGLRQLAGNDAAHDVRRRARGARDRHPDHVRWIRLRAEWGCQRNGTERQQWQAERGKPTSELLHNFPPLLDVAARGHRGSWPFRPVAAMEKYSHSATRNASFRCTESWIPASGMDKMPSERPSDAESRDNPRAGTRLAS